MEILESKHLNKILDSDLRGAMSYDSFRAMIDEYAQRGMTTGLDKSEHLIEYTKLNSRRFKRWEKTLKLQSMIEGTDFSQLPSMDWIVITETWCGDAAHLMPVMKILADNLPGTEIKVVLRDENEKLMDNFLTDGARSIPKLIARDRTTGEVLFTYGPRPVPAKEMVMTYKEQYGNLSPEFKEDLQRWYNKDKGESALKDLLDILDKL